MIELKKAKLGKKQVPYEKKPALKAHVCDGCGKIHRMDPYCNDGEIGVLTGTFDVSVRGNMFSAIVCSFKCAHELMRGGWKKMERYEDYIEAGANLVRCEVKVTAYVKEKDELIKEWKEREEWKPSGYQLVRGITFTETESADFHTLNS